MRKATFGSLSTLLALATLLLLVPSTLCQPGDSCPMRDAAGSGTGDAMACVPGPTFDCCQGDRSTPHRIADDHVSPRLIAVRLDRAPIPASTERPSTPFVSPTSRGGTPAETPLYTLLATLLI